VTVGAIVAQLRLDMTNFREGLGKANSLLEQYSQQASRAATMLGGIAAAAAGGLGVAIKWSAEFEQQMRNVNSILHETEPNIKALGDAVLSLAGKTGQAPATLARGLYDIASSGFEGADGLKVLEAAAKAATAGLSTTAVASRAITAVLNAYGMSASEAGHVSDVMFKTVERGVLTFEDLAQNMGDVVAMAATAKVPLEEIGAAIAAMTKAGIQPAEAFTSLNMVIRSLINPAEEAKAAAAEMGIQWNATGLASKGLLGTFRDLSAVLNTSVKDVDALTKAGASDSEIMQVVAQNAGMTTEKLSALFPEVRGLRGALVLASQGGQVFSQEMQFMAEATGSTARAFQEQSKALALQWQKTWATIQALGIEAGAAILPILNKLTNALRLVAEVLRTLGGWSPILRTLAVTAVALAGALAGLTAAFILYNTQIKASIPLMLQMVGAMRQMLGTLATTQVQVAAAAPSFAKLSAAAKGIWPALKAPAPAALGYGAIIAGIYVLTTALIRATDESNRLNDQLMDLYQRAEKVGRALPALNDLRPSQAQFFFSGLREMFGLEAIDQVKMWREQVEMAGGAVEQAERRSRLAAEQTADVQKRLDEMRKTALQNRLGEIERERQARIKAGVDERLANELAEQERVAARQQADAEMLKLEAQLLEAEGKTHEARVKAILAEAEEWRKQNEQRLGKEKSAEAAERLKRAKLIELARQEAEERAQAFEKSAGQIVTTWLNAVESMRQADQLSTSEYLGQLSKVLDLIRQMNLARAQAGQSRLFEQDELRLAQAIFPERKRMQTELQAGEKSLAAERKQWAQEELDQRTRLHEYELSLIDLTFQHKRDLARITGQEDEQTSAQIAQEELAALQQRRAEEQLSAQERLDSLERERQLILEIAQAGVMPQGDASKALGAVFEEMKSARDEIAAQEKAAFEERRKQHEETLKQLQTEQKTLRDQLSETGGRITQVAQSVFDLLEKRINALGTIKLEPAFAGALPGPGGGGRVVNLYFNGQRMGGSADIGRIADQLAELLEREVTHSRG